MAYNMFEVMALAEDITVSWDTTDTKAAESTVFDISVLSPVGWQSLEQTKAAYQNKTAVTDVSVAAAEASEILLDEHYTF